MIVLMCLLLNNCTSYKNYKQQQQLIETKKTWLNI